MFFLHKVHIKFLRGFSPYVLFKHSHPQTVFYVGCYGCGHQKSASIRNFNDFFSGITGTKASIVVVFISSVLFNIPRFFQWYSDSIPCAAGSKLYFRSPGALQSSDNVARKQVRVRLFVCLSVCLFVSLSVCLKTGASSSVCLSV